MPEESTFGCGDFLPGVGPGNFDDFDGGGTIDAGGGGGGPPDPPDPTGPPTVIIDGPCPCVMIDWDIHYEWVDDGTCYRSIIIYRDCKPVGTPHNPNIGAALTTMMQDGWDFVPPDFGYGDTCDCATGLPCIDIYILMSKLCPDGYDPDLRPPDDDGPVIPPPSLLKTYWRCIPFGPGDGFTRECRPITQAANLPQPPNSYLTLAECKVHCQGSTPTTPTTPGGAPGDGATCKCTITTHVFSPTIMVGGFCTIFVSLLKTCVPLGTPESGWRAIFNGYIADGWSPQGGSTTGVGVGCICGTNTCANTYMTLKKRCPGGLDDVSQGGGGGGGSPQDPPGGTAGGPTDPYGGKSGGGGGTAAGDPGGIAGRGLVGGAGGAPGGAPGGADKGGLLGDGSPGGGGAGAPPGAAGAGLVRGGGAGAGGVRGGAYGGADKGGLLGDGSPGGGGGGAGGAAGAGLVSNSEVDFGSLISEAVQSGEIDLNDPAIISMVLKKLPGGIEDPDIAFDTVPEFPTLVSNSVYPELFKERIDSNIAYILSNKRRSGNWDSTRSAGVTPTTVYNSLKTKVQAILGEIRNYDGTLLSKNQIFSMIGTRILDGTISEVTLKYLQDLAKSSKERTSIIIKRSVSNKVNEVAALAIVDRNKFTLDPSKAEGIMKNILPNWKTLASDIDKYIEVTIGGEVIKYYVKDDDTFIDRTTLGISDGYYFEVKQGTGSLRIFVKSEKDHAFLLPEATRQQAISLLGGTPGRTLEVSASILSDIEFDYSLSAPRQDFYVLSCVLSSIDTKPSLGGSFLLKESTAQYALMDTSTTNGLRSVNNYIKYKANHRVFILDDEDLMLDYITTTSSLTLKQTDILFDSPKENKTIPLLTRQIPWYIMVYPSNRSDFNIFNSKSRILSLETSGNVGRVLDCRTTLIADFSKRQTNKFIRRRTNGINAVNVYGIRDTQTRITQITPTDTVFTTGYIEDGAYVSAEKYTPSRKKTGFRLVKEIITELNNNYLLGLNGIGRSLTEFDVYSRLTLQQYNLLSRLESFRIIQASIRNGLIANVKVIPPINRADKRVSFQKTQLVRRKVGAPADTFIPVKGTKNGETIVPPTTTGEATFAPISR